MCDKVIFLDVDGVLNRIGVSARKIEPALVANLAYIVDETDAHIVVSSMWRLWPNALAELESVLRDSGLTVRGCTPDLSRATGSGVYTARGRGNEIQRWMDENGMPNRFVILDDNSDMQHLYPHLIKTSPSTGLTRMLAEKAVQRLLTP